MLSLLAFVALSPSVGDVVIGSFGPEGKLIVARPTFRWRVYQEDDKAPVSFSMALNGKRVEATYRPQDRAIVYEPEFPLVEGTYTVECLIQFEGYPPLDKNWTFTVLPDALGVLPRPTAIQEQMLEEINRFRGRLGLPTYTLEPRLTGAAQQHADYLLRNKTTGHRQKEGAPSFLGTLPGDRLKAFAWDKGSWEGVTFGTSKVPDGVAKLFHAPYHRIPFLQPGPGTVGTGYAEDRLVVLYEATGATGTVVSPRDGETGVPLRFDIRERPDPLRLHASAQPPVGYAIVFNHLTAEMDRITVSEASLSKDGVAVPIFLNSPANDPELDHSAILFPQRPLEGGTTYTVSVTAKDSEGNDISRTWSFTTVAAARPPEPAPTALIPLAALRFLGGVFALVPESIGPVIRP